MVIEPFRGTEALAAGTVSRWRLSSRYRAIYRNVYLQEYDGIQHWDAQARAYDIDRHARLQAHGWRIVRVSADILRYRPHVIVARTCEALADADADWPVIAGVLHGNAA